MLFYIESNICFWIYKKNFCSVRIDALLKVQLLIAFAYELKIYRIVR